MTFSRAAVLASVLAFVALPAHAGAPRAVAVAEARADGVQPEAAAMVTRQLYATAARLGLRVISEDDTARAARFSPGGPTPLQLLQLAEAAHADHAVFASLGGRDGRYVVTLLLANADRTGPFSRTFDAGAEDLEAAVDGAARALLAPPPIAPAQAPEALPVDVRDGGGVATLALQTEGALGLSERSFYNHLAGARLDYSFPGRFSLGLYGGYVNVKGKEGRASNFLPLVQLEYRIAPAGASGFRIPLRFGTGYLPNNGPLLRFAAGVSFPLGSAAWLTLDLLAPTVWIVKDSTVVSLNAAVELAFAL